MKRLRLRDVRSSGFREASAAPEKESAVKSPSRSLKKNKIALSVTMTSLGLLAKLLLQNFCRYV